MDLLCFFSLVFAIYLPLCASVLCALWSPAGKRDDLLAFVCGV